MNTLVLVVAAVAIASFVLLLWIALRRTIAEELARSREETRATAAALRQEVTGTVSAFGNTQRQDLESIRAHVEKMTESNEARIDAVRRVVDERLGDSFALVTERLEQVHKGLGEMQTLANGVGDLKKVLSNVKARGGWGEVQLETLLEQMLSPEQFERNVVTKEMSREAVEFAVKFPGKSDVPLLLPLDAKFPIEDYQHLLDAHDRGDAEAVEVAGRGLDTAVRNSAKAIREKYINPPVTTDFAIMFLPTEGLYAEVLRRPGLAEQIQRECGVLIAGPTTLTAILSSLQMGFRTLAIEKRSSEVWRLLEAVKTEFVKFGGVIEKVNRNLESARNQMDALATRTRVVSRKLRDVGELPEAEAKLLLKLGPMNGVDDEDDAWVERDAQTAEPRP